MTLYRKLGDDLDAIIRSFETNPAVTDRQRNTWRAEGRKKAITHDMLGCDHKKALAFADGAAVGSLKKNSARRFWDYAEGHVFPPVEDIIRFCFFMHLDLYRTLALVLKAEWERFFAHEVKGWKAARGMNLTGILLGGNAHAAREALARFQPREDLYSLMGGLAVRHAPADDGTTFLEGHTSATFAGLSKEMLIGRYLFLSVESEELARFAAGARREFVLLVEGTEEQQRGYAIEKARWVSLRQELEDIYLLIENQRLRNAHTRREWLALFGKEEIALREAALELEQRYALHAQKSESGMVPRGYRQLHPGRRGAPAKRACAAQDGRSPGAPSHPGVRGSGCGDGRPRHCRGNRRVPAGVQDGAAADPPAPPSRQTSPPPRLRASHAETEGAPGGNAACRPGGPARGAGHPEGYLLHEMRSLQSLKNALSRVEAILGNPGIEIDERLAIQGETLPEKLDWLQREVTMLEDEILAAKAELQALFEDEERARRGPSWTIGQATTR